MTTKRKEVDKEAEEENNPTVETTAEKIRKVPWICTCRWTLAIVGFFGFVNVYALRVNLSVAMVCMINHTAVREQQQQQQVQQISHFNSTLSLSPPLHEDHCSISNGTVNIKDGEFAWPKETQGLILSSFFWGYIVTQIPGGWLAQRFGGKRVIGYFVLVAVLSTLLSSVAARTSPYALLLLRILNGMGQGVIFPATTQLFSKWAPPLERSKLIGFTFAGAQIGNVLSLPLAAILCDYGFDGGWSSIFYIFGILGLVWFVLWMILVSDSPAQHRRITREEREYIETSIGAQKTQQNVTPWLKMATSPPVYAIIVAQTCCLWGTYMLLTCMPTYMKEVLKFDIKSNGILSAIPYLVFWACINLGGFVADYMRAKGIQTKVVRKIMYCIGTLVPGSMLIVTGYVTCQMPYVAVAVLSIAVGFSGFQYPGLMVNHADIAPPFAGVLFGIANTVATLSGIFAPYAVGLLTTHSTQAEWRVVFYLSAAIYLLGAIVFTIFGEGEIQPWVRPFMTQGQGTSEVKQEEVALFLVVGDEGENKRIEANGNGHGLRESS